MAWFIWPIFFGTNSPELSRYSGAIGRAITAAICVIYVEYQQHITEQERKEDLSKKIERYGDYQEILKSLSEGPDTMEEDSEDDD